MNWKLENPKNKYIDDITDEEAYHIASLSVGSPKTFQVLNIERSCNGGNIPYVKIHYTYFSNIAYDDIVDYMGIFHNLNIHTGKNFISCYCQKEIFEFFISNGY